MLSIFKSLLWKTLKESKLSSCSLGYDRVYLPFYKVADTKGDQVLQKLQNEYSPDSRLNGLT